jgi:hypothetical protein
MPFLRFLPRPIKYLFKLTYSVARIRCHDLRLLGQMQSLVLDGITSDAKEGIQFCWFTCRSDFHLLQMSVASVLAVAETSIGGLWVFVDPKSPLTEAQEKSLAAIGNCVNVVALPFPNQSGWGIQSILGYWAAYRSIATRYPNSWICKVDSDMLITSDLVFQHAFRTAAQVIRQRAIWYFVENHKTDAMGSYLIRSSAVLEMTKSSAAFQMVREICGCPGHSLRDYPEDQFFGGWFQSNRLQIEDIAFQLPCRENRDGMRLTWEEIASRSQPSAYLPSLLHFDGAHKDLMAAYFQRAGLSVD